MIAQSEMNKKNDAEKLWLFARYPADMADYIESGNFMLTTFSFLFSLFLARSLFPLLALSYPISLSLSLTRCLFS